MGPVTLRSAETEANADSECRRDAVPLELKVALMPVSDGDKEAAPDTAALADALLHLVAARVSVPTVLLLLHAESKAEGLVENETIVLAVAEGAADAVPQKEKEGGGEALA